MFLLWASQEFGIIKMKGKKGLPCPPAGAGANVDFHDGDERSVED